MAESDTSDRDVHRPPLVVTAIGAIIGLSTMLVLIAVMVWVGRAGPPPLPPTAEPRRTLAEVRAEDEEALTTYTWVDREQGIVRIPVERAIELLVEEARRRGEAEPGSQAEPGGQADAEQDQEQADEPGESR